MSRKPYKFGNNKKKEFLNMLREGQRRGAACAATGITRETFRQHYNSEPEFADAVNQAEMEANELVEDALFQAAIAGNVTAIQVWLYNRDSDRWADKRQTKMEHTGKDGEELKIKVTLTEDE